MDPKELDDELLVERLIDGTFKAARLKSFAVTEWNKAREKHHELRRELLRRLKEGKANENEKNSK